MKDVLDQLIEERAPWLRGGVLELGGERPRTVLTAPRYGPSRRRGPARAGG